MNGLKRGIFLLVVPVAVIALALAGCGGGGSSSSTSSSNSGSGSGSDSVSTVSETAPAEGGEFSSTQTAEAVQAGKKAGEEAAGAKQEPAPTKTIGFLNYTSQATALRRVSAGEEAAAKALGWEFKTCDAQGVPQKAATCATTLMQEGVDVISSTAIPAAATKPELEEAKQKGIPWLNTGGEAPRSPLYAAAFFLPEAKLYGPLDELLLQELGEGEVEIGALKLTVDDTARARWEAFEKELEGHPNVKVVDEIEGNPANPSAVSPQIVAMLQQHPHVGGIWSCCDILTPPIVDGVREAGLGGEEGPLVVGPFPEQAMLESIREGEIFAAVDLSWEAYGWMAVDESAQFFAHDTPFTEYGEPTQYPKAIYAGQVITQENVVQDPESLQPPLYDYVTYFEEKWKAEFGKG
jgi:ABC-type sugar transport system substrate-binding protein